MKSSIRIKHLGLKRTDIQEAVFSRIQSEIRNGANPKQFDKFITNAIDPNMSPAEKVAALQKLAAGKSADCSSLVEAHRREVQNRV